MTVKTPWPWQVGDNQKTVSPAQTQKPTSDKTLRARLLLDMTGSMMPHKAVTISAVNEYLAGVRVNVPDMKLSLDIFNSEIGVKTLVESEPPAKVPDLTAETYRPDAMTPLYDAVGHAIRALDKGMDPAKEDALVIIQTDGYENASEEFTKDGITRMIAERQAAGWKFVYLGCNLNAMQQGAAIGIRAADTMSYAGAQSVQAMHSLGSSTTAYARASSVTRRASTFYDKAQDLRKKKS